MFKLTSLAAALAGAALLAAVPATALAETVYDNLASAQDGSDPVFGFGRLADSFTNTTAGWLTGVSAMLANGSTDIVGTLHISLLASTAANTPGVAIADLGTVSSANVGSDFRSYSFTTSTAVLLDAGTRYWIALEALTANALSWAWSSDLSAPGVSGEFNYSATLGTASNASFAPYQMAVAVTAVPEPAAAWLAIIGGAMLAPKLRRRLTRGVNGA